MAASMLFRFVVFVAELVAGQVFFQDLWVDPLFDPEWIAAHHAAPVSSTNHPRGLSSTRPRTA